jgi:hypothetical protein
VASSAIRFIACAGVLAASLLIGGMGAGIAVADTEDAAGAGPESAAVTSKSDENNSDPGPGPASNPEPPTSTIGNGREDVGVQTKDDQKNNVPRPAKNSKDSWAIPIFRIPLIPTLAEFLAAIQPQPPAPAPAPGPAFRTQEVAPPVVDSGGGASVAAGRGGGVDPLSIGVTAEPPVLQTPLVIAPLPIPLAMPPAAPAGPLGAAAGAPAAPVMAADVAVVGAPVPAVRGTLPPKVEPPAAPARPMSAPAARLDYASRELRSPTAGELTLLALPGVAGLLLVTLSGGVIGYRQANSPRLLHTDAAARFLR